MDLFAGFCFQKLKKNNNNFIIFKGIIRDVSENGHLDQRIRCYSMSSLRYSSPLKALRHFHEHLCDKCVQLHLSNGSKYHYIVPLKMRDVLLSVQNIHEIYVKYTAKNETFRNANCVFHQGNTKST